MEFQSAVAKISLDIRQNLFRNLSSDVIKELYPESRRATHSVTMGSYLAPWQDTGLSQKQFETFSAGAEAWREDDFHLLAAVSGRSVEELKEKYNIFTDLSRHTFDDRPQEDFLIQKRQAYFKSLIGWHGYCAHFGTAGLPAQPTIPGVGIPYFVAKDASTMNATLGIGRQFPYYIAVADIARRAKVSAGDINLMLNCPERVAVETAAKILQTSPELVETILYDIELKSQPDTNHMATVLRDAFAACMSTLTFDPAEHTLVYVSTFSSPELQQIRKEAPDMPPDGKAMANFKCIQETHDLTKENIRLLTDILRNNLADIPPEKIWQVTTDFMAKFTQAIQVYGDRLLSEDPSGISSKISTTFKTALKNAHYNDWWCALIRRDAPPKPKWDI